MADALWLTESDAMELMDLPTAINVIDGAFRSQAAGASATMSKAHLTWGGGHTLHAIGAVDSAQDFVATKTWAHTAGGATPLLLMWQASTGSLVAVIEFFALGQLRTGAVSGVATRYLASPDADQLAVIGSGKQALAQVAAVAAVRPIRHVRVHSPTPENRDAFAASIDKLDLDLAVTAVASVEEAVENASIVTTVTRAREAFLHASMLGADVHINAVGAITPERRELAADVIDRAVVIAADDPSAARSLTAEFQDVPDITPLCDVVIADEIHARSGLTVFKAMGVGLADLALGAYVLAGSRLAGTGRDIPEPRRVAPNLREK